MGSSLSTEEGCVLDGMEGEPAYRDHVLSANDLDRMDGLDTSERSAAASPRAVANLTFSSQSVAPGAHGSLSDSGERTLHDWQLEQGTPAAGSAAGMQGGSPPGSTYSCRSEDTQLATATLAIERIAWMLEVPLPVSQRASSGLRCTSTSRLVPNQHQGALALFAARVRSRRTEQHARESDASSSVLSATPPLFSSHQGYVSSQTSTSSRPCNISTAMERVMRVERMRAGKVRATSRPKARVRVVRWSSVALTTPTCVRGAGIPTQSVEPVVKHALPLAHSALPACLAIVHGSSDNHAETGMACS